jgi:hypothetical protein
VLYFNIAAPSRLVSVCNSASCARFAFSLPSSDAADDRVAGEDRAQPQSVFRTMDDECEGHVAVARGSF